MLPDQVHHHLVVAQHDLDCYRRSWLRSDVTAGLSVAAIALPVGIAYADLAGVPPVGGMYSAIFPLFVWRCSAIRGPRSGS